MSHKLRVITCFVFLITGAIATVAQSSSLISADQIWSDLAAGNQRFVLGKVQFHDLPAQRKALAKTQHPRVAVLSCSDSRVPPELVFDAGLGDLFVVRSAGESDDPLAIGSLEYAVEHLGSSMIVVMGHQSCGAVIAACSGGKSESPNLDAVLSPITPECSQKDPKAAANIDHAIHEHIEQVAQDLLAKSKILKAAVDEGKLTIVQAYYSLDTGEVIKLH